MAIIVNPAPPPQFRVNHRVGADKDTRDLVDSSTVAMQRWLSAGRNDPLGPVERNFVKPHAAHGTMRAHHVADHEIQQMVCDFMNNIISLPTMLDRMGTLYLTSWVDVWVTRRIFTIWAQWMGALKNTFLLTIQQFRGKTLAQQAAAATQLTEVLSSSLSNLRIGHRATDTALGHAIAPRLQRGQFDLIGYFIGYLSGHNFAAPTLSVETSLVASVWDGHFRTNPLPVVPQVIAIENVFLGPAPGGAFYISEENPAPPGAISVIPVPQRYPGTVGAGGYVLRATRATIHMGVMIFILIALVKMGSLLCDQLVWPKDIVRDDL